MPYQPYQRRRAAALLFLKTLVRRGRPPGEDAQVLLDRYPVEVWYLGGEAGRIGQQGKPAPPRSDA